MKSLMFAVLTLGASLCVTFSAMAENVTVWKAEFAGRDKVATAITKLGKFADQPLMAGLAVAAMPEVDEQFGSLLGHKWLIACDKADFERVADACDASWRTEEYEKAGCTSRVSKADLPDGCLARIGLPGRMLESAECIEAMKWIEASLWVTDAGVDLKVSFDPGEGSEIAKALGEMKKLGADPFARTSDRSVLAFAFGADEDYSGQIDKLLAAMKRNGAGLDFIDCTMVDGFANIELDVSRLAKAKIDLGCLDEAFEKAVEELPDPAILLKSVLQGASLTLKGVDCETGLRRGKDIFPGEDLSECDGVATISLYRIAKALVGTASLIDAELFGQIKPIVDALPSGDGADIGVKTWREGARLNITLRVTPAEIKGLAAVATLYAGAKDLFDKDTLVEMIPVEKKTKSTSVSWDDEPISGSATDFNGFAVVNKKNKKGEVLQTTYRLYKTTGKERKLVREICVSPTAEDREFDKKWLSGVELVTDKAELETAAYRRVARHVLKALEDEDEDFTKVVVERVIKAIQERDIRPRAGKPGISKAILDVLVGDLPEIRVSFKASDDDEDDD